MSNDFIEVVCIIGGVVAFFVALIGGAAYSTKVSNDQKIECYKVLKDKAASELLNVCGKIG